MNRFLGPALALVLIVLVGFGLWQSAKDKIQQQKQLLVVGLTGSEKMPFFRDPSVIEALASHGIIVDARKAGSRQIASHPSLKEVDFAFPAGTPAASKIKQARPEAVAFTPFYTPMAIVSWQPIVDLLTATGFAKRFPGYAVLDMKKLLTAFQQELRWVDLPENQSYPSSKQILVKTTDVRKSNSAAMFLSLMSYLLNQETVVITDDQVDQLFPTIEDLFLKQGFVESSSQVPFEDYLVMGMGHTPLLFVYEAQFIGIAAPENGGLPPQAALIYPEPGIFSKHVFLALTAAGKRLGELLENDESLKRLAVKHGFRNDQRQAFNQHVEQLGLELAPSFINIIEPPSYEVTEKIITRIEQAY